MPYLAVRRGVCSKPACSPLQSLAPPHAKSMMKAEHAAVLWRQQLRPTTAAAAAAAPAAAAPARALPSALSACCWGKRQECLTLMSLVARGVDDSCSEVGGGRVCHWGRVQRYWLATEGVVQAVGT